VDKTIVVEVADSREIAADDNRKNDPVIPDYLQKNYWWAYLDPRSVKFFEHQWIVNLILWGNFARLRDAALAKMGSDITGRTLQIACVYGDFTPTLARRLAPSGRLDVVDVAPIQLENLRRKIGVDDSVFLHQSDASDLRFANSSFDHAILFFLLHELPLEVRKRALREALRVIKPGGKLVIVDYHRPGWWHPLRYLMLPVFKTLEPFALDLWQCEIADWIPPDLCAQGLRKSLFFGGLYQQVIITR
jgi:ubiquinone/menaquinone biosynthesis C-methylase UbiE